jgi:hypothetical protein
MSVQPIIVANKELDLISIYHSSLKKDYAAGVGSVEIYNINQFAINIICVIGDYGNEGSEIIKTHASTAPTGNTVTFASNTTKPHSKDTPIHIYAFDQIEFSHADTLTGSKSVLGSIQNLDPTQSEVGYNDTANTSGYYFTRYKNSITGNFSDYSDGIPYSGLPINTVGYAIDTAMNELDAKFSETLTFTKLIGVSRQMLKLVRGKMKAWSKYQEYDYLVGTASQGTNKIPVPNTLYDKNSNRSVLNVRIGSNGIPLNQIDRDEYLRLSDDSRNTTVVTQAAIAATSIVLADTSDLDDSGSIDIFVSGVKYTISYSVNTRSTNTLSGIGTDQITIIIPVSTEVWQNAEYGTPEYFNVSDGYLYFWPMVSSSYEGRNIVMDFYTDIEEIDSQMDVILGTKFDMLIPYLKWKIRTFTENNGKEDLKDPSLSEFRELLNDAKANDAGAEEQGFRPRNRNVRTLRDSVSNHYL